jgi:hypothetical protein
MDEDDSVVVLLIFCSYHFDTVSFVGYFLETACHLHFHDCFEKKKNLFGLVT